MTKSDKETFELGRVLGTLLDSGDVVGLFGPLGVGKTVLAKGIGRGLGVREEVLSPSFNIVLEYVGRVLFRHVDFYRLRSDKEASDMGMEEYIGGDAVTVIEWAEKLPTVLPSEHLKVNISFLREDERKISFKPHGRRFEKIVIDLIRRKWEVEECY